MPELIYLDNYATTPIEPRVLEGMLPYFHLYYGNASSTHYFGREIKKAVEASREKVARLINANSREIIFTSGATEAINLALKGLLLHPANKKRHIITAQTEHKAVLDTCKYLEQVGIEVTYLPVDSDGLLNLQQLKDTIRQDTLLISIMLVNNETGVIQDIKHIADIAHAASVLCMTDATQAVGKIPINVNTLGADVMVFSGHKFHGPKGIGALYLNSKAISKKQITPLLHGGGQEDGLISGTLNVPAIIGLGIASDIARDEMIDNTVSITAMRDFLEQHLLQVPSSVVNGRQGQRLYNITNISFPDFDANVFIGQHRNIAISNGSACTSAVIEPSHVLKAMNRTNEEAFSSIRITISKFTTILDVEQFKQILIDHICSYASIKF